MARSRARSPNGRSASCPWRRRWRRGQRVWQQIEGRIGAAQPKDKGSFWRALALMASGAAAALVFMTVVLPPQKAGAPAYVALLSDAKTQRPVLYVTAARNDTQLRVKALDPSIHVADSSLEPKGGSRTGAPTGPVLYSGPCVKDW